ncbi:MAG: adenylate/guanylate cyclase domain-containing protein [Gammaproteobacteria bacterium]
MNCARCGRDNPPENAFCGGCGTALERTCPSCARSNPPDHHFCGACGTPLQAAEAAQPAGSAAPRLPRDYTPKHLAEKILQSKTALEGERKQVTVLFCDIQGSMQLAQQLDPEHWHRLLERYFAILTEAVHRYEGTVNQYTGDGIMALFGAPLAHEDHAQRACYAALAARDALRTYADELRLTDGLNFSFRLGLNSGEVVVGKIGDDLRMDYTAQGATVGIAQRIEQLAAPGCVYLGGATERLVHGYFRLRAMGETNLKGLAEAVALFELEAPGTVRSRLDVSVARGLSRFVGRAAEMQVLETALANAGRGHGQVVGIVGEAGLGKSRLCYEFVEDCRRRGLPVYEAHCPAHGRNIPYLPVLELFRNYFDVRADDDAVQARRKIAGTLALLDARLHDALPVLLDFMGVADPQQPAPRMDAEARQRQLYELVHRLVEAQDAGGQLAVTLIDDLHWIDPGSDAFVNQLVAAAAGRRSLVVLNFRPEYQAAFAGKAHYQQLPLVPLGADALGELLGDLLGTDASLGELVPRIVKWTAGNPFYTEEVVNALVESGDLVGQPGHYRLVSAIDAIVVPTSVRAVLAARIDRLPEMAKRLLQTAAVIGREFAGPLLEAVSDLDTGTHATALERLKAGDFVYERALYPVFEYAFKHPLTHEVAYQSLLQSRRAALHAAVARAIEARAGDKLDERAAQLAHHWQAAGERPLAARWHWRAADWVGRTDLPAAHMHWEHVRELLREGPIDEEAATLGVAACRNLLQFSYRLRIDTERTAGLLCDGQRFATVVGDVRNRHVLSMAYAHALSAIGDVRAASTALEPAEHYAREQDDRELVIEAYVARGFIDSFGTQAVDAALDACDAALAVAPSTALATGLLHVFHSRLFALLWRAGFLVMGGRLAAARAALEELRRQAQREQVPELDAYSLLTDSLRAHIAHDAETLRANAQAFEAWSRNLGEPANTVALVALMRGYAALVSGDFAGAVAAAADAFERHLHHVEHVHAAWSGSILAEALMESGDHTAAIDTARQVIAHCERSCRHYFEAIAHSVVARAMLRRDGASAADAAARELHAAGQWIASMKLRVLEPALAEWQAELAAAQGDDTARRALIDAAIDGYAAMEAPYQVARLQRIQEC